MRLEAAREGLMLLKNNGDLLPLDKSKIKSIAIVGPNAYPAVPVGGGSAGVQPFVAKSYLEGLSNYLGTGGQVQYARGVPTIGEMAEATNFSTASTNGKPGLNAEYFNNETLQGTPVITRTEQHINFDARSLSYYDPEAKGWRAEAGDFDVLVGSLVRTD